MLNFIKTAIITIIVSFISGLLLDYYKNLAPRILCTVQNDIIIHINNKKFCAYIITVSNTSNKTIHELTLNIQSLRANLKSTDAKITKGLKFDSSVNDNILDFYIPFLSKGDKFTVTVYVENQYAVHSKPVIAIRSPENFKEIDSVEQNGILSLLSNIPKNINQVIPKKMKKAEEIGPNRIEDFQTVKNKASDTEKTINREVIYENKKLSTNEKAMIIIVSFVLVIVAGALVKSCFDGAFTNTTTSNVNPTVTKLSNDSTGTTGNSATNSSSKNLSRNSAANSSSENLSRNSAANSSSENLSRNSVANSSSENLSRNSAANSSSENLSRNSTANSSSENLSRNSTANSSSENLSGNSTGNSATNSSSGNSTGNSAANSSSENSTGNSGN